MIEIDSNEDFQYLYTFKKLNLINPRVWSITDSRCDKAFKKRRFFNKYNYAIYVLITNLTYGIKPTQKILWFIQYFSKKPLNHNEIRYDIKQLWKLQISTICLSQSK